MHVRDGHLFSGRVGQGSFILATNYAEGLCVMDKDNATRVHYCLGVN